jgi:hypothetical protein
MNGKRDRSSSGYTRWAAAALLWVAGAGGSLFAQSGSAPATVGPARPAGTTVAPVVTTTTTDSAVVPAGCSSCSRGLAPDLSVLPTFGSGGGGCSSCGGGGCACYPGREPCDCCIDESTCCGRLLGGIYHCICCPDPCYEPRWNALADAAFWASGPRPATQMKFRYDHVWHYPFPDKAEYLWARSGGGGGKGPGTAAIATSYRDLLMYTEVGIDRFSASVSVPYIEMMPDNGSGASGFGDITIGTKSLILDCELMQFAFAFDTIIPAGNFTRADGTGHVSLEPAFLMALKLAQPTYLQAEVAYRIPIGGDQAFEGPVLHYHFSLNHLLWSCGSCNGIKLIATAELNGYELLGGAYFDPVTGTAQSAKNIGSIINIGPGIRLVVCDKVDFGIGSAFNITTNSMGDEAIRAEFRWRF